jgi:hypothetical protein
MKASLCLTLFCSLKLYGVPDSIIDARCKSIPEALQSADQIATYLCGDYTTNREKVRAFYVWIANNIKYDNTQKSNTDIRYPSRSFVVGEALSKRKGSCQHYSELFNMFCQKAGIKSFVINGYARRSNGEFLNISHCWNAVVLDSAYYNLDVTWGAGYVTNSSFVPKFRDDFFLIKPQEFIKTHLPFDPVYQFSDNPINIFDFNNQDFSKPNVSGNYDYAGILSQIAKQDTLTYLEEKTKRIIESGGLNELVLKEINELALQVSYRKCINAVDSMNEAVSLYNVFLMYKNGRFRDPQLEDADVAKLVNTIERQMLSAENILNNTFTFNKELNGQIYRFKELIKSYNVKVEKEKVFLEKYLKKPKNKKYLVFM